MFRSPWEGYAGLRATLGKDRQLDRERERERGELPKAHVHAHTHSEYMILYHHKSFCPVAGNRRDTGTRSRSVDPCRRGNSRRC